MPDSRIESKPGYVAGMARGGRVWVGMVVCLGVAACGPEAGAPALNLARGGETSEAPIRDDSPESGPVAPSPVVPPPAVDSGTPPAPDAGVPTEPDAGTPPINASCENKAKVYDGGYQCAKHFELSALDWWIRRGVLPEDFCQCLALERSAELDCSFYATWGTTDGESVDLASPEELTACTPAGGKAFKKDAWRKTYKKWFEAEAKAGRCYDLADGTNSCRRKP